MVHTGKRIQRTIITFIAITLITDSLFACTTFVIHDSTNLVYGRNFDWDLGAGFIVINNKGLEKQSIVRLPYKPAKWISKFGSVTFNQVGIDMPMGGMNEKGLVIAQMGLFETKYPEVNGENIVNDLEWIQYQLDNSSTLEEVIENTQNIHIDPIEVVPVHYLVCDSSGNIGVVEFLDGKVVIVQGNDVAIPVCSNMIYEQSLMAAKSYKTFGGQKEIPQRWDNIPDIIAIADSMIKGYRNVDDPVDYSFKILEAVGSDTRTQWSIVFDIKNRNIHYRTLTNKSVRIFRLDEINFTCNSEIKIVEIGESNNETKLLGQFEQLTFDDYFNYKKELVRFFESNINGFPVIPESLIKSEAEYILNRKCN